MSRQLFRQVFTYRRLATHDRDHALWSVDHRIDPRMGRRHDEHGWSVRRELADDARQPIGSDDERSSRGDHVDQPAGGCIDRKLIGVDNVVLQPHVTFGIGGSTEGENRIEARSDHHHRVSEVVTREVAAERSFGPTRHTDRGQSLARGGRHIGEHCASRPITRPSTGQFGRHGPPIVDDIGPRSHQSHGGRRGVHRVRPWADGPRRL